MIRPVAELLLWGAAAFFAAAAVRGWQSVSAEPDVAGGRHLASPASPRRIDLVLLRTASSGVTDSDPFRLDRRPATVPFGATVQAGLIEPPPPPAPPRPSLRLVGTAGGPPWQGVLEGVPGREGSVVVRPGDVLGELRVRSVRRDSAVVQGMDTVWHLVVRRP